MFFLRSLTVFPSTKRKRAAKARQALQRLIQSLQRPLWKLLGLALALQCIPLLLVLVLHNQFELILKSSASGQWQTALNIMISVAVVAALLRAYCHYRYLCLAGEVGHRMVAGLRQLTMEHLLRMPVSYLEERGAGRLLLRFIGDSDALRNWVSKTGPRMTIDSGMAVVILGTLVYWHWPTGLLVVSLLTILSALLFGLSSSVRSLTRESRSRQSRLTGLCERMLSEIRQTKLADANADVRLNFQSANRQVEQQNVARDRAAARVEAVGQLLALSILPGALVFSVPAIVRGELSAADGLGILWLLTHLITMIRSFLTGLVIQQKALISFQRLYLLLARPAEKGRGKRQRKSLRLPLSIPSAVPASPWAPESTQTVHWEGPGVVHVPAGLAHRLFDGLLGFQSLPEDVHFDGVPLNRISVAQRRRSIGELGDWKQCPSPWESPAETLQQMEVCQDELPAIVLPQRSLRHCDPSQWTNRERQQYLAIRTMLAKSSITLVAESAERDWDPELLRQTLEWLGQRRLVLRVAMDGLPQNCY